MLEIKQKGNRFYQFSRMQFRSFPIKKSEALEKIANGEAVLVDKFITDPDYFEDVKTLEVSEPIQEIKEEVKPQETKTNVINFTDRFQVKQEKKSLNDAFSHYLNNILPNLKLDEMKKMMDAASDKDKFNEELMRATLRIHMEKAMSEHKGGVK